MKTLRFRMIKAALAAAFSFLVCVPAFAEMFPPSPWTKEEGYFEKSAHKLGFGVLNLITGWSALLFEPALNDKFLVGVGKGLLYTVTNTAGGAIHAATFPIPVDVPLPEGGVRFQGGE